MKALLAVGAGGCFGAIARYLITLGFARIWSHPFPLATFAINVSGSFVLGWLATWLASRSGLDPAWRLALATGFLGAYTTFSTFEYETRRLMGAELQAFAVLNVLASVLVGYVAVFLGTRLAQ